MILFIVMGSIAVFHIWSDRSRYRELYSSALTGCYLRLVYHYIGADSYKLWEYHNMPLPIIKKAQIPFVYDFTFVPIASFFFMQYMPKSKKWMVPYYLLWASVNLFFEWLLRITGHLHFIRWNHAMSFIFLLIMGALIHWQYIIFRKWWSS